MKNGPAVYISFEGSVMKPGQPQKPAPKQGSKAHTVGWVAGVLLLAAAIVALWTFAYRTARVVQVASEFKEQVRYLVENGGTIGEAPASETFSVEYLQAIFGDNPELLEKLKGVVREGLAEEPALNLGEVAAMMVTYHKTPEGKVMNVVVHAIGGFALARDKPGFHRSGYFFQQLDKNLWNYGNLLVSFLGRDMVLFAADEQASQSQQMLLDSLFSGDITVLVDRLVNPMYFTAVFPDPRHIVPSQLRNHIQAVIIKGSIGHHEGHVETVFLAPSVKSAEYAMSILKDMKLATDFTLKARFKGVKQQKEWGEVIDPWWAYEMVLTLEHSAISGEQNLIRMKSDFQRVMVNAVLKGIERMSRDLAAMRGTLDEKLDPRVVDAKLKTAKPLHYWSEAHQWGPDWPIPPHGIVTNGAAPASSPAVGAGASADSPAAAPSTPPAADAAAPVAGVQAAATVAAAP